MSSDSVWSECLGFIYEKINNQSFQTWFKPTTASVNSDDSLTIEVPNQFFAEWLEEHYLPLIEESVYRTIRRRIPVIFSISSSNNLDVDTPTPRKHLSFLHPLPCDGKDETQLNPRYTFETFVVGESNQLAYTASMAASEAPGKTSFNPLYIYGGVGLGKTHLIQAIGHFIREERPEAKIRYVTSEKFTFDFINSIGNKTTAAFSNKYRDVDLLLVDDIQFFTGKERTQSEFFHTFNAIHQRGKQIVLTSDRPPREIKGLEDRLLSRFAGGLVADIQSPDLETRIAILRKKANIDGLSIPGEVTDFIASNVTSNIRELEGSLIRLLAYSSVMNQDITIQMAREALRDFLDAEKKPVSVEQIQKMVAEHYHLSEDMLIASKRTKEVAIARQVAMYLCRKLTNFSLKTIGLRFGGRDHSTVIHACKTVDELLKEDHQLRMTIRELVNRIGV